MPAERAVEKKGGNPPESAIHSKAMENSRPRASLRPRAAAPAAAAFVLAAALVLAGCLSGSPFGTGRGGTAAVRAATVRLTCVQQSPSYYHPWSERDPETGTGSGVVISGGLILTNAHVVAHSRYLTVRFETEAGEYEAEVVFISHQCDLALVRVRGESPVDRVRPLDIADRLPGLGSTVATYGYPHGGESVSITRGVVSRMEYSTYSHSGNSFLLVQTDAAINPGNSGGPVVQNGQVVGIAFQVDRAAENMGFLIPAPIISHFLEDVRDGRCDGFPELGVAWQSLENPGHRRSLGMGEEESGVLLTHVYPLCSAGGSLLTGDVLLSVDGEEVAVDGSVPLQGIRVPFSHLIDGKQVGEEVRLGVLRGGSRESIPLVLAREQGRIPWSNEYERPPRYLVYGGLIFQPLTLDYMEVWQDWPVEADLLLRHYFINAEADGMHPQRREFVVINRVLSDGANAYLEGLQDKVVDTINGRAVTSLRDAAEALANPVGDWVVITTDFGEKPIVLRAGEMAGANERIRTAYDLPRMERME